MRKHEAKAIQALIEFMNDLEQIVKKSFDLEEFYQRFSAISLPSQDKVDRLREFASNKVLNRILQLACWANDLNLFEQFFNLREVNPAYNNNFAICWASIHGYVKIIDWLLPDPRIDPSANNDKAICFSAANGHIEVVKRLLTNQKVNPSANDNYALGWASRNGHLEVVKLLLADPRLDLTKPNVYAIQWAYNNSQNDSFKEKKWRYTEITLLLFSRPEIQTYLNKELFKKIETLKSNLDEIKAKYRQAYANHLLFFQQPIGYNNPYGLNSDVIKFITFKGLELGQKQLEFTDEDLSFVLKYK